MTNTNRTEVFFVYIAGQHERDCKSLAGARRSAAALRRAGFADVEIVRSIMERDPVTGLGRGWNESVRS